MKCQTCGVKAEVRPYGKDGTWICFSCGMLAGETTVNEFKKRLPKGNAVLTPSGPLPYIGPIPE